MDSETLLHFATLCLFAALVMLSIAIVLRHAWRTAAEARYEMRTHVLRPQLLQLLADDDPDLSSLNGLGRRDAKLVESLVWQLIPKLRGAARAALVVWLQHQGAIEKARQQTRRPGAIAKAVAAEHLGQAGLASTSKDVERLLHDRRLEVRIVAARAFGGLGDPSAVRKLLDLLEGPRAIPQHLVAMALIHIGEPATPALIGGLARPTASARAVCAYLLGYHMVTKASRWLVAIVQFDPSDEVRIAAIVALGRAGSTDDVDALARNLGPERSPEERLAVAEALGRIGGDRAAHALHAAVNDADAELRVAAAQALASTGAMGAQILIAVSDFGGEAAGQARDQIARTAVEDNLLRQSVTEQLLQDETQA